MTTAAEVRPLLDARCDPDRLWARAFREAYRTELRAEAPERGDALYRAFADRYDAITRIILHSDERAGAPRQASGGQPSGRWRRRRLVGKTLSVLRLMKSAFTFEDGAAYLVWKIRAPLRRERRADALAKKRHPILASGTLFWKIYRAGGFR